MTGIRALILSLLVACAVPVQAQRPAPLDCLLEPNRVIDVSSAVRGVLSAVAVDRGDLVEENQIVARLDSSVEEAAMELAQARANANAEVQADKLNAEFAARRSERFGTLYDRSAVSGDQKDESETVARLRELELQQARENQHLAQLEARQAEEILKRHAIRSPVRGVVVHRYLSPGESAEDRPILRIAEIQTLRAEAIIPVAQFGTVKVGQQAVIVPEEPLTGHYVGTVSVVDRVADAASGTFRARVTLPNSDYALPSGLRCAVRFLQPGESAAENIPEPPVGRALSRTGLSPARPRDLASAPSTTPR
jgi:RND family efflux transporter MFP subunit